MNHLKILEGRWIQSLLVFPQCQSNLIDLVEWHSTSWQHVEILGELTLESLHRQYHSKVEGDFWRSLQKVSSCLSRNYFCRECCTYIFWSHSIWSLNNEAQWCQSKRMSIMGTLAHRIFFLPKWYRNRIFSFDLPLSSKELFVQISRLTQLINSWNQRPTLDKVLLLFRILQFHRVNLNEESCVWL